MRDPARIKRILEKVEKLWAYMPDMRFFQLTYMFNPTSTDGFYVEDYKLEEELDRLIKANCIE